jgi:hypothetical protein
MKVEPYYPPPAWRSPVNLALVGLVALAFPVGYVAGGDRTSPPAATSPVVVADAPGAPLAAVALPPTVSVPELSAPRRSERPAKRPATTAGPPATAKAAPKPAPAARAARPAPVAPVTPAAPSRGPVVAVPAQ